MNSCGLADGYNDNNYLDNQETDCSMDSGHDTLNNLFNGYNDNNYLDNQETGCLMDCGYDADY